MRARLAPKIGARRNLKGPLPSEAAAVRLQERRASRNPPLSEAIASSPEKWREFAQIKEHVDNN
jgi:hypothetical protein